MALLGNYSVLNKNPGRAFAGSSISDSRYQSGKSGPARGQFTSVEALGFSSYSGVPNGYRPPYSWVLPQVSGALSTYTSIMGSGSVALTLAGGKNAEATLAGFGEVTGTGGLIVSAVANLVGSGTISSADARAILSAAATLSGSGTFAATVDAIGFASAGLSGVGTVSPTPTAIGVLEADLTPFTELSPQSLAASVWSSPEGKFLYAVSHHKTVTDPAAGTFTVYDEDGTTVLYVADLWENAAGTTAYQGQGADRRDSF